METKTEVKPVYYREDYTCDTCLNGKVKWTGAVLVEKGTENLYPHNNPKYPHTCNECNSTSNLPKKYPNIVKEYEEL